MHPAQPRFARPGGVHNNQVILYIKLQSQIIEYCISSKNSAAKIK